MSERNGGPNLQGGVMLGGRQRTIFITRDEDAKLTVLAKMTSQSPLDLLGILVSNGIERAWQEMMATKLIWMLANWITWSPRWK